MKITFRKPDGTELQSVDEEHLVPPEDAPEGWTHGFEDWENVADGEQTDHEQIIVDRKWVLPLVVQQRRKWEETKKIRAEKQAVAHTVFGDAQSDTESLAKIGGLATYAVVAKMMELPYLKKWTMMDNDDKPFDADMMLAFGMAVGDHIDNAHAYSQNLRKLIDAATTEEELHAIDIEEGWPE